MLYTLILGVAMKSLVSRFLCLSLILFFTFTSYNVYAAAIVDRDGDGIHIDDLVRHIAVNKPNGAADLQNLLVQIRSTTISESVYNNVYVTGVSVTPTSAAIQVGGTQQLGKRIVPANASNQIVNWGSNNISVALVDNAGLVTGVGAGTAVITATTVDGSFKAASTISVSPVPVSSVSVNPTSATIYTGDTQSLVKTILPIYATNQNVTWSSSNTSVATVDALGVVTGVGVGTATITVTTVDGGHTAAVTITVVPYVVQTAYKMYGDPFTIKPLYEGPPTQITFSDVLSTEGKASVESALQAAVLPTGIPLRFDWSSNQLRIFNENDMEPYYYVTAHFDHDVMARLSLDGNLEKILDTDPLEAYIDFPVAEGSTDSVEIQFDHELKSEITRNTSVGDLITSISYEIYNVETYEYETIKTTPDSMSWDTSDAYSPVLTLKLPVSINVDDINDMTIIFKRNTIEDVEGNVINRARLSDGGL
jgi:uncharacterized protein YjdB